MSELEAREVHLQRLSKAQFRAVNPRGGMLDFGEGSDMNFTPVELLLAAIAGCSGIDVDYLTSKRSEPTRFEIHATGDKVADDDGNRLTNIRISFDVTFDDSENGKKMADRLPDAIARSHDRLCSVSRSVELGTPVEAFEVKRRGL